VLEWEALHFHPAQMSISLAQYDAHRLPFTNDSFDLVFSFETIYYLENRHAFLAEARQVAINPPEPGLKCRA
jgi:ubiquinone/menaquinone biosynthesis C-methylase UbiE